MKNTGESVHPSTQAMLCEFNTHFKGIVKVPASGKYTSTASSKTATSRTQKHAPCLYIGIWEGKPVLLLRQVDDIAGAAKEKETLFSLYKSIDKIVPLVIEPTPMPLMYGVNINQTQHYVQLTMETYIGIWEGKPVQCLGAMYIRVAVGQCRFPL